MSSLVHVSKQEGFRTVVEDCHGDQFLHLSLCYLYYLVVERGGWLYSHETHIGEGFQDLFRDRTECLVVSSRRTSLFR